MQTGGTHESRRAHFRRCAIAAIRVRSPASGSRLSDVDPSQMNANLQLVLLALLLQPGQVAPVQLGRALPIYEYLKDLCPTGQMPVSGRKSVKTCGDDDDCPLGTACAQGICCVEPPMCRHPIYRRSTGFACLPNIKQNCPAPSLCAPSTRDGMSICCESTFELGRPTPKPALPIPRKTTSPPALPDTDENVCPESHPVIAHDGTKLISCKNCNDGVCVHFRDSDMHVCCQSHEDVCGTGSTVQMDGHLPRDCTKRACSTGFECSLTSFGSRVCCSLATCANGKRARAVCAAGCRRDENCERVQGQQWCCPKPEDLQCPRGGTSNGESCSPQRPLCPLGSSCERGLDGVGHLCCLYTNSPLLPFTLPTPATKGLKRTGLLTLSVTRKSGIEQTMSYCLDGQLPLLLEGTVVTCPELDEPCPKAGFSCKEAEDGGDYLCCPVADANGVPAIVINSRNKLAKVFKGRTLTPPAATTSQPAPVSENRPTCPFSYEPSRSETSDDVKTCFGLFALDCPLGFTCLPSSTTDNYLCCTKSPRPFEQNHP